MSTTTEASDFFKGAELEDVVMTIFSTKAVSDFLDPPTPEALDVIVGQVARELRGGVRQADIDRLDDVVGYATDAFWARVADEYDHIKSGDLDPLATAMFEMDAKKVITSWLEANS